MENVSDVKDNYLKTIKNGISVITYFSLCLNLYVADNLVTVFTNTLMFSLSAIMTFYALNPNSEKLKKRRNIIVKGGIYLLFGFVAIFISSKVVNFNENMLVLVKVIVLMLTVFVPIFSVKDDTDDLTSTEKEVAKEMDKRNEAKLKNKKYKRRDEKSLNNRETKKFVEKKKTQKE